MDNKIIHSDELKTLRFQIGTSKGGRRHLPYVFTKQGVSMLSAILKSIKQITVRDKINRLCLNKAIPFYNKGEGLVGLMPTNDIGKEDDKPYFIAI